MVDKTIYNVTQCQAFSPCGNYLVAGNNYGDIGVFHLSSILKGGGNGLEKKTEYIFLSPRCEQVCSMVSTENFLIAGTVGEICGWDWNSIIAQKPKLAWTINIPIIKDRMEKTDVNSLAISDKDHSLYLYAGCGDNRIYVFGLEDGKQIRTLEGHTDYIHSIFSHGDKLVSGGEDGTVRLWDMRQNSVAAMFAPFKSGRVARPYLGKWIGDVAMTQDWLVCGGGPELSMWHLRSLELMTVFNEVEDSGIHVCRFTQESLLAGGNSSHFYQLSYTGQVLSKLDTSSPTIFSAISTETPSEILSLGGSSGHIDICTNFKFRHQILTFA